MGTMTNFTTLMEVGPVYTAGTHEKIQPNDRPVQFHHHYHAC